MKKKFVAASGRVVTTGLDGSVGFDRMRAYLAPELVSDAEQYFEAKRDAEVGRWRWEKNPHLVCYRVRDYDAVLVVSEVHAEAATYTRAEAQGDGWAVAAARAYFEAHPVAQPWHKAREGQFWAVTRNGDVEICRVDDVADVLLFFGVDDRETHVCMPITHHSITAAVRMMPEAVAS